MDCASANWATRGTATAALASPASGYCLQLTAGAAATTAAWWTPYTFCSGSDFTVTWSLWPTKDAAGLLLSAGSAASDGACQEEAHALGGRHDTAQLHALRAQRGKDTCFPPRARRRADARGGRAGKPPRRLRRSARASAVRDSAFAHSPHTADSPVFPARRSMPRLSKHWSDCSWHGRHGVLRLARQFRCDLCQRILQQSQL